MASKAASSKNRNNAAARNGQALAIGSLCRIFCSPQPQSGTQYQRQHLDAFYTVVIQGLQDENVETMGPAILQNITEIFAMGLEGSLKLFIPLLDLVEQVLTKKAQTSSSRSLASLPSPAWQPAHQRYAANLLATLICVPGYYADHFYNRHTGLATVAHDAPSAFTKSLFEICLAALAIVDDSHTLQTILHTLVPLTMTHDGDALQALLSEYEPSHLAATAPPQSQPGTPLTPTPSSMSMAFHTKLSTSPMHVQDRHGAAIAGASAGDSGGSDDNADGLTPPQALPFVVFKAVRALLAELQGPVWPAAAKVSLAALETLRAYAEIVAAISASTGDSSFAVEVIAAVCLYIDAQILEPLIPKHRTALHTMIVAGYYCLYSWVLHSPGIVENRTILRTILRVAFLGLTGSNPPSDATGDRDHVPEWWIRKGFPILVWDNHDGGQSGFPVQPPSSRIQEAASLLLTYVSTFTVEPPAPRAYLQDEYNALAAVEAGAGSRGGKGGAEDGVYNPQHPIRYFVFDGETIVGIMHACIPIPPLDTEAKTPTDTQMDAYMFIRDHSGRFVWQLRNQFTLAERMATRSGRASAGSPSQHSPAEPRTPVKTTTCPSKSGDDSNGTAGASASNAGVGAADASALVDGALHASETRNPQPLDTHTSNPSSFDAIIAAAGVCPKIFLPAAASGFATRTSRSDMSSAARRGAYEQTRSAVTSLLQSVLKTEERTRASLSSAGVTTLRPPPLTAPTGVPRQEAPVARLLLSQLGLWKTQRGAGPLDSGCHRQHMGRSGHAADTETQGVGTPRLVEITPQPGDDTLRKQLQELDAITQRQPVCVAVCPLGNTGKVLLPSQLDANRRRDFWSFFALLCSPYGKHEAGGHESNVHDSDCGDEKGNSTSSGGGGGEGGLGGSGGVGAGDGKACVYRTETMALSFQAGPSSSTHDNPDSAEGAGRPCGVRLTILWADDPAQFKRYWDFIFDTHSLSPPPPPSYLSFSP